MNEYDRRETESRQAERDAQDGRPQERHAEQGDGGGAVVAGGLDPLKQAADHARPRRIGAERPANDPRTVHAVRRTKTAGSKGRNIQPIR